MAAFADALDLRTAVISRAQLPFIVEIWDQLVALVESDIFSRRRTSGGIFQSTVTVASGIGSLPTSCVEVLGLYDSNGYEYIQVPVAAVRAPGYFYAIDGATVITSLLSGTLDIDYYKTPDSLTLGLDTTNYVLENRPNLYFTGIMAEVGRYTGKSELTEIYAPMFEREFVLDRAQNNAYRFSRARVRLNMVTP